jgi:hypothetical protein
MLARLAIGFDREEKINANHKELEYFLYYNKKSTFLTKSKRLLGITKHTLSGFNMFKKLGKDPLLRRLSFRWQSPTTPFSHNFCVDSVVLIQTVKNPFCQARKYIAKCTYAKRQFFFIATTPRRRNKIQHGQKNLF